MLNETQYSTDESLFQSLINGDEKAFDILFLKYYPSLCAYARQFVEYDDGQEIVQDVMVWLWENREMHAFEVSPKSYLFKVVKNRCLTLISRNEVKRRIIHTLYNTQQLYYEDPDFYIVEELTQKIEEALKRLPDNYREAFEMNRFRNMTYGEIAAQLGVSSQTVAYRIQQALKQLRLELKDYLPILFAII